jgi:ferredoxin-NADP reductase
MFNDYIITNKYQEVEDTFIFNVKPKDGEIFDFSPGQYTFIKNPLYEKPDEEHPFSIASSPRNKEYLEFCIKVYGNWTKALSTLQSGDTLQIAEPRGNFIWENTIQHPVFLLGGIGISPIMSMLRTLAPDARDSLQNVTMLYGNRTPETIAYKKELTELQSILPNFKIVDIFSHLPENHSWNGYRGFITQEIIKNEVDFNTKPIFFIIGPPVFIEKMIKLLKVFGVPEGQVKTEDVSFTK